MRLWNFLRIQYYKFKTRNMKLTPSGYYFFKYLEDVQAGSPERIERHEEVIANLQTIQGRTREEMISVLLKIRDTLGRK